MWNAQSVATWQSRECEPRIRRILRFQAVLCSRDKSSPWLSLAITVWDHVLGWLIQQLDTGPLEIQDAFLGVGEKILHFEKTASTKTFSFLFFFFFDHTPGRQMILGQGLNPRHSRNNARSLITWPPGDFQKEEIYMKSSSEHFSVSISFNSLTIPRCICRY